ncbi:hypothetical protein ACHAWF_013842 [Thalassiosira exigua]
MGLLFPIFMFAAVQNYTTLISGSIQTAVDSMDSSLDEEPTSTARERKTELKPLLGSLKVSGVKFRYEKKQPDVIKGVDVNIHKGLYNVLCGGSGSGKTTILNMLMRFQQPHTGSILWDGTSIYDASLDSFRGQIDVTGAVGKAAQDAEIHDFISLLPKGYDTVIGGDASGGMSCAVLLLDEATSALDSETEHSIIETLVNLRDKEGLTIVSVSHHPSTAIKADKIVVLEQGVVSEEGPYNELVSRGGGFSCLVKAGEE